ncbi:LOW QUALITY PROTEIN: HAUS augmin-like complex subunit 5 [Artibeus jamaicensis]|uniref:LOW QUALITY PROTEIN: HAUS augmin-like complex subunit 5 n=1 Tax=Artibeus jamaicensis TaxID=9417 RepID=UPI00235A8967|nr:LOW QUALITY PROTEIN: HAUS augmin-like complex subunit 5 [Artibeus jamaicensis]
MEARELVCWAWEEMEAPEAARVPESTLRRLCLGQGADIWAYVLRHVHSQRNVKKIRGNLLWYGHQYSPEACRKKLELEAAVARLRTEIQELDQSLELMDQETEAQDMAMEQALQSMQDTQQHVLLLRAQAGAMQRQQCGLQHPMQWLQNQLRHLQDMERKAKMDVTFGPLTSAALGLEPVVLSDVRTVCTLRTQFLQNLLVPQTKGRSTPTHQEDHFGTSYQQWLSSVETLLANHPPRHVLAALEHLAAEREAEIRSLCSPERLQDTGIARSQVPDQSDASQALPSVVHLIQEGWQAVSVLVTQRGVLLKEHQILTQRLQSLMKEMERCTLGSCKRQAWVLGLRDCGLRAELKALCAQIQELEEAAGLRQLLLQELQTKQQRILHWRQLVGKTQEQVRLLIKGNSASKTHLCRSPGEVLALVQQKVVPTSEAVTPQSQELLHCLEKEAQHLSHLLLGTLLQHSPGGLQPLPTILPSVYQLHPAFSRSSSLMVLSHMLGLPTGKAPELLLPKAASLRQDLLFFQDRWSLQCWDQLHMKTSLPPGPSTQGGISQAKLPSLGSSARACPCPSGSCAGSKPKAPCSSCADEEGTQTGVKSTFITLTPQLPHYGRQHCLGVSPIVSTHTCHLLTGYAAVPLNYFTPVLSSH